MSRLAKKSIPVGKDIEVRLDDGLVAVKGPKGEISRSFPRTIALTKLPDGSIEVTRVEQNLETQALVGSVAAHLKNMLHGVSELFTKQLILEGIGYKSELAGTNLNLSIGLSHPVKMVIPQGLTVTAEKNVITIKGVNTEQVGGFAAKLRAQKLPEPYKGKGFRYSDEVIRRKEGKKTA